MMNNGGGSIEAVRRARRKLVNVYSHALSL
jgi:hypothetical protein